MEFGPVNSILQLSCSVECCWALVFPTFFKEAKRGKLTLLPCKFLDSWPTSVFTANASLGASGPGLLDAPRRPATHVGNTGARGVARARNSHSIRGKNCLNMTTLGKSAQAIALPRARCLRRPALQLMLMLGHTGRLSLAWAPRRGHAHHESNQNRPRD